MQEVNNLFKSVKQFADGPNCWSPLSIEGPEANYRNAKKLAREAGRGCLDWTRDETWAPQVLAELHVSLIKLYGIIQYYILSLYCLFLTKKATQGRLDKL
jgi:hypothetical protein